MVIEIYAYFCTPVWNANGPFTEKPQTTEKNLKKSWWE